MMKKAIYEYRDHLITYEPKPILSTDFDFEYVHKDFDGPDDTRCGVYRSIRECTDAIDRANFYGTDFEINRLNHLGGSN